jgi:hypothetical protein
MLAAVVQQWDRIDGEFFSVKNKTVGVMRQ